MSASRPVTSIHQAQTVAGAIVAATIGYAVVGSILSWMEVIPREGIGELEGQTALLLKAVLLVAGFGEAAASFVLRRTLDSRAEPGEAGLPVRFRNMIVAMALSEGAGLMGFVVVLLSGDRAFAMLLWGVAVAACVLHFPTRAGFGLTR